MDQNYLLNSTENPTSSHWGTLTSVDQKFSSFKLSAPTTILGRNPTTCQVVLDDARVCPQHCILTRQGPGVILTDISQGGLWVNKQKIGQNNSVTLKHKDQISLTQNASDPDPGLCYVYEFNFGNFKRDTPENFSPFAKMGGKLDTGHRGKGIDISDFEKLLLGTNNDILLTANLSSCGNESDQKDTQNPQKFAGKKILVNESQEMANNIRNSGVIDANVQDDIMISEDKQTPDNLMGLLGDKREISEEFRCGVCLDLLHQTVTLMPCLHNFCGGCVSNLVKHCKHCPLCKSLITEAKHNPLMSTLISKFLDANPEFCRQTDELSLLDSQNIFKDGKPRKFGENQDQRHPQQIGFQWNFNGIDNIDSESISDDADAQGTECLECDIPRPQDGYLCAPGGPHLTCQACLSIFPDRDEPDIIEEYPNKCAICENTYCTLYYGPVAPCQPSGLKRQSNHDLPQAISNGIFRGNFYEAKILSDYLTTNGLTTASIKNHIVSTYIGPNSELQVKIFFRSLQGVQGV